MDKSIEILVVEDNVDINNLLCNILKREGYNVRAAFSGSEARMCLEHYTFDLILLDLMLPGVTGEELIEEIRKKAIVPIIVITAKTEQEDKINVLKSGADDYIVKPFDVNEVVARVMAQLRRYKEFSKDTATSNNLKYKNLEIDLDSRAVVVNGVQLSLTVREFDILELLVSNPNKVFTRANLFESVWKDEFMGDENTVNVHISNLRSKISKACSEEYIQTVWGIGFKLKQ